MSPPRVGKGLERAGWYIAWLDLFFDGDGGFTVAVVNVDGAVAFGNRQVQGDRLEVSWWDELEQAVAGEAVEHLSVGALVPEDSSEAHDIDVLVTARLVFDDVEEVLGEGAIKAVSEDHASAVSDSES
jgi:hypothetical protein